MVVMLTITKDDWNRAGDGQDPYECLGATVLKKCVRDEVYVSYGTNSGTLMYGSYFDLYNPRVWMEVSFPRRAVWAVRKYMFGGSLVHWYMRRYMRPVTFTLDLPENVLRAEYRRGRVQDVLQGTEADRRAEAPVEA